MSDWVWCVPWTTSKEPDLPPELREAVYKFTADSSGCCSSCKNPYYLGDTVVRCGTQADGISPIICTQCVEKLAA